MSRLAAERIIYITSQLNEHGIVRLKDMAKELNVSEATIRRDVDKLEKKGILVKVKGGVANAGTMEALDLLEDEVADTVEYSMKEKQSVNKKYKIAVAQYAASLVKDGECIYVDGGTSLSPLTECLLKRPVQIVTNSVLSLHNTSNAVAKVFVVGGALINQYGMCVGPAAQATLKEFHFNRACLGCTAVSFSEGYCYTTEMDTAAIKQDAMQAADESYLLLDSSKLNAHGFCRMARLDSFAAILCNCVEIAQELPENFLMLPIED